MNGFDVIDRVYFVINMNNIIVFKTSNHLRNGISLTNMRKKLIAGNWKMNGRLADATKLAGQRLLAARRLVERGVRFVQVFPSPYGVWDSHQKLREKHAKYLTDEKRIKAVTVCFSDLVGRLHMLDYDKKFLLGSWDNLTFDGSSIRGFTAQKERIMLHR